MTSNGVTALTDLLLSLEALVLAAALWRLASARQSAAWYWRLALGAMGLGALLGALHHGLFPPPSVTGYWLERVDWIVLAVMTYFFLMATAAQFFPASKYLRIHDLGVFQLTLNIGLIQAFDNFLLVTLNYAPVMLLLLAVNVRGLRNGTGSWPMLAGLLFLLAAVAIQASGIDTLAPLDHNGLYHVVSMIGVWFLYLAGKQLKRT